MGERETGNTCLTCRHNFYIGTTREWVDCNHPVTLERGPKWQPGDPAIVNYRTADVPISRLAEMGNCPAYEFAGFTPDKASPSASPGSNLADANPNPSPLHGESGR